MVCLPKIMIVMISNVGEYKKVCALCVPSLQIKQEKKPMTDKVLAPIVQKEVVFYETELGKLEDLRGQHYVYPLWRVG